MPARTSSVGGHIPPWSAPAPAVSSRPPPRARYSRWERPRSIVGASEIRAGLGIASPPCRGPQSAGASLCVYTTSSSLLSVVTLSFGVAGPSAGCGCAGVKPNATTTGSGGAAAATAATAAEHGGSSTGNGGTGPVARHPDQRQLHLQPTSTPRVGHHLRHRQRGELRQQHLRVDDHRLSARPIVFPSNLGPIQVQMSTSGTSARINFQTLAAERQHQVLRRPASRRRELAVRSPCRSRSRRCWSRPARPRTSRSRRACLNGSSPTGDSAPINSPGPRRRDRRPLLLDGRPEPDRYCPSRHGRAPATYCLQDTTPDPKNGTAIYRYDFSQTNPAPEQVWTDDGGPLVEAQRIRGAAGLVGRPAVRRPLHRLPLDHQRRQVHGARARRLVDLQRRPTGRCSTSPTQALDIINPTAGTDANSDRRPATRLGLLEEVPQGRIRHRDRLGAQRRRHGHHVQVGALLQHGDAGHRHSATIDPERPRASRPRRRSSIPISRTPSGATTASHAGLHLVQHRGPGGHVQRRRPRRRPEDGRADRHRRRHAARRSPTTPACSFRRQAGHTNYYPCVSEDSNYVVYNQSSCGAIRRPPTSPRRRATGTAPRSCDGYDDSSAKLWWVSTSGSGPTSGSTTPTASDNVSTTTRGRASAPTSAASAARRFTGSHSRRGGPYGVQAEHRRSFVVAAAALVRGRVGRRDQRRRSEPRARLAARPEHPAIGGNATLYRQPRSAVGQGRHRHRHGYLSRQRYPGATAPVQRSGRQLKAGFAALRIVPGSSWCRSSELGCRLDRVRAIGGGDGVGRRGGAACSAGAGGRRRRAAAAASDAGGATAATRAGGAGGDGAGGDAGDLRRRRRAAESVDAAGAGRRGGRRRGRRGRQRRDSGLADVSGTGGRRRIPGSAASSGSAAREPAAPARPMRERPRRPAGRPTPTSACVDCLAAGGACENGVCTFACGSGCSPCTAPITCPMGIACKITCPAGGCNAADRLPRRHHLQRHLRRQRLRQARFSARGTTCTVTCSGTNSCAGRRRRPPARSNTGHLLGDRAPARGR